MQSNNRRLLRAVVAGSTVAVALVCGAATASASLPSTDPGPTVTSPESFLHQFVVGNAALANTGSECSFSENPSCGR